MSILFKTLTGLNSADVPEVKPLTLRNVGTSSANVSLTKSGSPIIDGLQYRMEGEESWLPYTVGTTTIKVNPNEAVQFQNTNETLSTSSSNYAKIYIPDGNKFNAEGNIQSILNYSDSAPTYCFYKFFYNCRSLVDASQLELSATTLANGCYSNMFYSCKSLVNVPALHATALAKYCYQMMFRECTSLVNAPELPATTLALGCYSNMFFKCTSLTTGPELLATTLDNECYSSMFGSCTSLVNAPELLPATTLTGSCYRSMFSGCRSLVNVPELPATTLASYCYTSMFSGCTSLVNAPELLPATNLDVDNCYQSMFSGCTSLTTAPELPATTLKGNCYSSMFNGCTNLKEIKVHFTAYHSTALTNWVNGVSATGTFYKLTALPEEFGTNRIPNGWTVVNID